MREATPFRYYTEPMLLGQRDVVGHPLPRTAERYSMDSSCALLDLNLTVDGHTGALKLVPGRSTVGCGQRWSESSHVSCAITAHEGGMNFTTQLVVEVSNFLAWESSMLIVPADRSQTFPAQHSSRIVESLAVACLPQQGKWLELNGNGTMLVKPNTTNASQIPGLTALNVPGLEKASGSLCRVSDATNESREAFVVVVTPQIWSSICYPRQSLAVALNISLNPMQPMDGGLPGGHVPPSRYSASCQADQKEFEVIFDELSGEASASGFSVFHLDPQSGALHVSPEASLSHLFDLLQTNKQRASVKLSCIILGHFEWQVGIPVPPIRGDIDIFIEDSTCWAPALESVHGWIMQEQHDLSEAKCRADCRADGHCGVYKWVENNFSTPKCYFLIPCGPHSPDCHWLPSATEKISTCGLGKTCLSLTARQPVWLYQGQFCPSALAVEPETDKLSWIYIKKEVVVTAQDLFYMQGAATDPEAKCAAQGLLLTRSNATWDFQDSASYMELFGEHVACLEGRDGSSPILVAFAEGKAELKVSHAKSHIGEDLMLTLQHDLCSTLGLGMNETNADSQPDAFLIDDPTTATPNDFSLHPCDCFPMSWGNHAPVISDSFLSVPAGSNNVFRPKVIEIAQGSYMCEQASLIVSQYEPSDMQQCRDECLLSFGCKFVWFGTAASLQQCRLYKDCHSLLMVESASGMLASVPKEDEEVCRIADGAKCWAVSKRRAFLNASTGAYGASKPCRHQSLVEQCDSKLLLGGLGIERCFGCVYSLVEKEEAWQQKRRLPQEFRTGTRLTFSCWEERYAAVTPEGVLGARNATYTISCTGGQWWGPDMEFGLSGFACGQCAQIIHPNYAAYQEQQHQASWMCTFWGG
ncbi:Uncharacterized protein SCF082_LOCUS31576 [Durusdinium trenchii]